MQGITGQIGHRFTAQEARGNKMSTYKNTYEEDYDIWKESIDKTKLRRKLEEDLRKEMTVDEMVELALKRGVKVPHYPETPPDYHDESGRQYFGPKQVRHASDLEVGKEYIRISTMPDMRIEQIRCRFDEFIYLEENPESGREAGWHIELIPLKHTGDKAYIWWDIIPLWSVSLHPMPDGKWKRSRTIKWLEFAPPITNCDCPTDYDPDMWYSKYIPDD